MNITPVRQFRGIEIFAFTFCSTITLGVTFLPYVADEEIRSAWLKVVVAVFPYLILAFLLKVFCSKYDSYDFFKELKQSVWKWLYVVIGIYFLASTIASIIWGLEGLGLMTSTYLLRNTERWIPMLLFIVISAIGVLYGITAITRFVVSLIFLEVVVLLAITYLGFSDYFKWVYIPPVWSTDVWTFLKSSLSDMARYAGVVALLGFLTYVQKGTSVWKPISLALLGIMVIFASLSIVVLGTFGFEQSLRLLSPATALVQSTSTRTGVFERLDLYFIGIWLIAYYKIMIIQTWFAVFLVERIFSIQRRVLLVIGIHAVIFTITLFTESFVNVAWVYVSYNQLVYSLLVPIVLLLYLIVKKGAHGNNK